MPARAAKRQLRAEFRAKRQAMSQEDFLQANARIAERLLGHPGVAQARCVFSYVSFGREADTRPILRVLLLAGKRVYTPLSNRSLDIERCYAPRGPDDALLSPDLDCPPETPAEAAMRLPGEQIDLYLTPGLVWDLSGYRIGFGGGYFDKLLGRARAGALKIGLAFDFQLVERLPREAWDVPVDAIVTERRIVVPCQG